MGVGVVWLKRDLRVRDHGPLFEAAARGPVVVLYVHEPGLWARPEMAACHHRFIAQSLPALDDALAPLGGRVSYRTGPMLPVLETLAADLESAGGIDALYSHQETGLGWTFGRDRAVTAWATQRGIRWHEFRQDGVRRPHPSRDGWASRWTEDMAKPIYPVPKRILDVGSSIDGWVHGAPATAEDLGLTDVVPDDLQPGGLVEAETVLRSFLRERGLGFRRHISSPLTAWDGGSRLSPHLAWGTLSTRDVWMRLRLTQSKLRSRRGPNDKALYDDLDAFESRLRWRGHFMQKLEDQPGLEFRNQSPLTEGLRTAGAEHPHFRAWAEGRTGLPMVDACMRSLIATKWLNFRMRAMLMSVASYHLWLHWREPAQHLARQFLDFEPGIHFPQAQMQSGTTAINSLRIYDPFKQGRDQDPDGRFIRRWVPKLRDVPDAAIHAPHEHPDCAPDYPAPIVDAVRAAARARRTIEALRRTPEARAESQAIHHKHGSRRPARSRPWR